MYLTGEGHRVYAEVFPRITAIQRERLASFSAAQREPFSGLMDLLQAQASRLNPGGALLQPLDDASEVS